MNTFLDTAKAKKDDQGIWVHNNLQFEGDIKAAQEKWEKIYDFDGEHLVQDRVDFHNTKLKDHIHYIEKSYKFTKNTIYLEIGCGPSYIGEYLMNKYNCHFIGVDFNYPLLVVLKKYLDRKNLKNYTLIYSDINDMPLKDNSVHYIYGGGVIEHMKDTAQILRELYRVLKIGGVSFNTVPAFNLWWLTRFFYSIPVIQPLRGVSEFIHEKMLKGRILEKYYGYELSFLPSVLISLHEQQKYTNVQSGAFAFHPNVSSPHLQRLGEAYFLMSKSPFFCPFYYVHGEK